MSNSCERCGGVGYIETEFGNKTCSCMLAESIKQALQPVPKVLLSKTRKLQMDLFPENVVLSAKKKDVVYSILKTVFTSMFLKGRITSMDLVDSDTVMEAYFNNNEYYTISSLKESEFLALLVEDGKTNKILPEVIQSIVNYRCNILNKPTWVWLNSPDGNKVDNLSKFSELAKFLNAQDFTFRSIK